MHRKHPGSDRVCWTLIGGRGETTEPQRRCYYATTRRRCGFLPPPPISVQQPRSGPWVLSRAYFNIHLNLHSFLHFISREQHLDFTTSFRQEYYCAVRCSTVRAHAIKRRKSNTTFTFHGEWQVEAEQQQKTRTHTFTLDIYLDTFWKDSLCKPLY